MATPPNLEVVRRNFEAQSHGRIAPDDLDPEVVLVPDPSWPESTELCGRDAVMEFFRTYYANWETHTLEWDDPIGAGDRVVVHFRMGLTGRVSGADVVNEASSVYTLRDGKINRIEYFFDHADALRAAGLDPG